MKILGIETSCDETSAAVVEETGDVSRPWAIRSNVIASQVAIHREWGGVVPELASRQHVRDICGVVERAMSDAGVNWTDLGAVAVTQGPGLVGSLLVGLSFAKAAAAAAGLPVIGVHHLAGHIESVVLHNGELPLPAVMLVVSGGHTSLYLVTAPGVYELLSRTRDDAAGEAYDKVARLLGLGYPGGPIIDKLARQGNDTAIRWPGVRLTHADRNAPELRGDLDFSFSGLKTSILYFLRENTAKNPHFGEENMNDICASVQQRIVSILLNKLELAAERFQISEVAIAGGVSANSALRSELKQRGDRNGWRVFIPPLEYCTDNAAMIASVAYHRYLAKKFDSLDVAPAARMEW